MLSTLNTSLLRPAKHRPCKCHLRRQTLPRGLSTHAHGNEKRLTREPQSLTYRRDRRSGSRARIAQLASCLHACGGVYVSTQRRRRPIIRHTTLGICLALSACAQMKVRVFTGSEEGHAGHHGNGHNRCDGAHPHGALNRGTGPWRNCVVGKRHESCP